MSQPDETPDRIRGLPTGSRGIVGFVGFCQVSDSRKSATTPYKGWWRRGDRAPRGFVG